jgi:hypothetical protein
MNRVLLNIEQTAELIQAGKVLSLAGDESLLKALPKGNWIGGSIPYFVAEDGGQQTKERIFVTEITEAQGSTVSLHTYDLGSIKNIATEAPANGFTILIVPALSAMHAEYANHARDYDDMFMKPIVGWVSGVHLDDLGKITPKVFNGATGEVFENAAVALNVSLADNKLAIIKILNLFKQGAGDVITFPEVGFSAAKCWVNGVETNFADYVTANKLDLALPLVADYHGAQINTSFQAVDAAGKKVAFYAPVFPGIEYRQAAPVGDYVSEFDALASGSHAATQFSCNCILNYLYGKLEGRKTGDLNGPMTFGEIAYQLLNQTLVYLEVIDN